MLSLRYHAWNSDDSVIVSLLKQRHQGKKRAPVCHEIKHLQQITAWWLWARDQQNTAVQKESKAKSRVSGRDRLKRTRSTGISQDLEEIWARLNYSRWIWNWEQNNQMEQASANIFLNVLLIINACCERLEHLQSTLKAPIFLNGTQNEHYGLLQSFLPNEVRIFFM